MFINQQMGSDDLKSTDFTQFLILINTQAAEQSSAHLSKFINSFREYSYPKSTMFLTVIFHLKNCTTTDISSYEQTV